VTPERWREVETLFHQVRACTPQDRVAILDRTCSTDPALRREVESLLAADEGATGFLEPVDTASVQGAADDRAAQLTAALAGRYVVLRELGRGGMATVYLAQDLRSDRLVALKVMRAELSAAPGRERFLREIRTTARLQHPHILPVLDSGEAAGLLWYAMPFVRGASLRERLRREVQLEVDAALDLARQIALALDYAHREGIVHRDLKPENILLSEGQALVADFGVAKALEAETGGIKLTETGLAVGTPQYMAPEQSTGGAVDARSDVYALATVLYEMLAGEPPYTGTSVQAVLAKRLLEPVPHLRTVREEAPEAVERVLLRALAKVPADRFQSAGEFARALGPGASALAGAVATPTVSKWRPGSRRRTSARLLMAALVGCGLGAVALVRRPANAPPSLDADLVAVAPFDVFVPGLELWHEGLADLLARSLDGAGPLRTASPAVVIRGWRGRSDRSSAGVAAQRLGAGLAVYGTLVPEGRDSVRLTASVLDARLGTVAADAEAHGPADQVARLADSLALRLLGEMGRVRPLRATRSVGLGSRSLPAVRAFLRGEQFFRRTEWDSAWASYQRASELDTAFALALWRLGTVRAWQYGAPDSLAQVEYVRALQAAGREHSLPPREGLLITFDSLMWSLDEAALPDSMVERRVGRLFRTAGELTRRYPSDPASWAALGEARLHFGLGRGAGRPDALAAFAQAIALDSAYAPAYLHMVELAATLDDRAALRRYADAFLALHPRREDAIGARTVVRLTAPQTSVGEVGRLFDTLPAQVYPALIYAFRSATDSEEMGPLVWRRFVSGPMRDSFPGLEESGLSGLAGTLAYRAHLREAGDVLARRPGLMAWGTFTDLALAGVVPAKDADAAFRQQLREGPTSETEGMAPRLGFPLPWWGARRDTVAIRRYAERLTARATRREAPLWDRYLYDAAGAYLALARADTAEAVRRLETLPAKVGMVWYERLTLARLLAATGHERDALAVLDREFPWAVPVLPHGWWALERARLAERLGERDKAIKWYGYVARLWRHADPELQPRAAEAREALARLGG
jgi:serine/threonine-protein kinase